MLALSTFATLLPVWLGITVLLNGERRTWGLWLAGGSLIIAGGFFAAHTAMVDGSLLPFPMNPALWFIGWSIIVLLPTAWYVTILWFGGYWELADGPLRRRHRLFFPLVLILAAASIAAVIPFVGAPEAPARWVSSIPSSPIVRTPLATVVFPAFLFATIALALDALRTPPSTGNPVVDNARGRARRQLIGTTLLLLAVTALSSFALVRTAGGPATTLDAGEVRLLQWLDLAIVALITAALLVLASAIVSYEIFTGKTLPRRGLQRHLRNAVALAVAAGALVGAAHFAPVNRMTLLLAGGIGLMCFYALVNWKSYQDRQRFLEQLRPHADMNAADRIDGFDASASSVRRQFDMMCSDVLECSRAVLMTFSPVAPRDVRSLSFPRGTAPPRRLPTRDDIGDSRDHLSIALDPAVYDGYVWCIPLSGQSGIEGALLVADKVSGGLYTQEEIEVARSTTEQITALASNVELARRLIDLQSRRVRDRVLVDAQTRRVLHDEILPAIHAMVLSAPSDNESRDTLAEIHRRISDILRSIPSGTPRALGELGLIGALRHTIETEHRNSFDQVVWHSDPIAEELAGNLTRERSEALFYAAQEAVRNAARYARGGRDDRAITLTMTANAGTMFELIVEDDGVGISNAASGRDAGNEGSGEGLALHSTLLAVMGGSLTVESRDGQFTQVVMRMPLNS